MFKVFIFSFFLAHTILAGEAEDASVRLKKVHIFIKTELQGLSEKKCFTSWISQLKKEGFDPEWSVVPRDKQSRDHYQSVLKQKGYSGSIFIGNLKLPRYHVNKLASSEDFDSAYELMNTQTTSAETGNPSILVDGMDKWFGIISDGEGTNLETYCKYFDRNLVYRTCNGGKDLMVLSYIDRDWAAVNPWLGQYSGAGMQQYKCLSDTCFTLERLGELKTLNSKYKETVDFLQVACHSNPTEHACGGGEAKLTTADIQKANPHIRFYNLFACSAGQPCDTPNLAETYLMRTDQALAVIASTKIGSTLQPGTMYKSLLNNSTFGEAHLHYLKQFFNNPYERYLIDKSDSQSPEKKLHWLGGVLIYGDPTLNLHSCKK